MSDWLTVSQFAELVGRNSQTVRNDLSRMGIPHQRRKIKRGSPESIVIHVREVELFKQRLANSKRQRKHEKARPNLPETHPRMLQGVARDDGIMQFPSDREWNLILKSNEWLKRGLMRQGNVSRVISQQVYDKGRYYREAA